jgi:single-stranded-DNA-specific exonuclease
MIMVGPELVHALEELEPHGMGNPAPLFALRGVRFNFATVFGKEQNHLKMKFENGLEGIWWRGAQRFAEVFGEKKSYRDSGQATDMVFQVGWNGFHRKIMLDIRDVGNLF